MHVRVRVAERYREGVRQCIGGRGPVGDLRSLGEVVSPDDARRAAQFNRPGLVVRHTHLFGHHGRRCHGAHGGETEVS